MSNINARLYRDFAGDCDRDRMIHVRQTQHGTFRAVVAHCIYPDAPDFERGSPVVCVDVRTFHGTGRVTMTGYGKGSAARDGLPMGMDEAYERVYETCGTHRRTVEVLDRWLRTYHGGSLVEFQSTIE